MVRLGALVLLLAALALPTASYALRPRVILVLFDGLSLSDLSNPRLANLDRVARSGQIGLMTTAVSGGRTSLNAAFTLALGALSPSEATDAEIYGASEQIESTAAANVYRRRIGTLPRREDERTVDVAERLVHVGWAPIMRRGMDTRLIGPVLAKTIGRPFLAIRSGWQENGDGREIGLFGVDAAGVGPAGSLLFNTKETEVNRLLRFADNSDYDLAYKICWRDAETRRHALTLLDAFMAGMVERDSLKSSRLMLVSPHPIPAADGSWDRLSIALFAGQGIQPGLSSSPTTRTTGLISNVDIAPTLLSWMEVARPPEMVGIAVPTTRSAPPSMTALHRLDRIVHVNGRAYVPVFVLIGSLAAAAATLGFISLYRGKRSRIGAFGTLAIMSMPLAMLLAASVEFPSVAALAGGAIGIMCALSAVAIIASRNDPARAPVIVALGTLLAVFVDGLVGQPLIKFSLFSAYKLQGIRYYGIGNEYEGVLLGYALIAVFMGRLKVGPSVLLFALTAFMLGWPAMGADAGGAIAAVVTFTAGGLCLLHKRCTPAAAVGAAAAGVGFAFALAFADRAMTGTSATHLGGALNAAGERGWAYLGEIVGRKIGMNVNILTHPAFPMALVGAALIGCSARKTLSGAWEQMCDSFPIWRSGLPAVGWGSLAALIFNDTGAIAALYLAGGFLASGAFLLFTEGPVREPHDPESGRIQAAATHSTT